MPEFARKTTTVRPSFIERRLRQLLVGTGIEINGPNPWDPQVHNPKFFWRVLTRSSIGLGESYMDGWWDCEQIDEMVNRLLRSPQIRNIKIFAYIIPAVLSILFNLQKRARAFQVGELHYDIGNDLYKAMLDEQMVYTCGYWRDANNLNEAQRQKLDLVCQKLNLKAGMRVLDIGCGWGSFAKYAAQNYGVEVVGVTISKEQVELGNERCRGLPVKLRLQDYRDVNEKFDAIVSLGMFEHVGHKNHNSYMKVVHRCMDKGRFLLHTIGKNHSHVGVDPWTSKYIFPNGEIPSLKQITKSLEANRLMIIEDLHNFGADYDKTLMAWFNNFDAAWSNIEKHYPDNFYRMWKYYLHLCAGAFRARNLQLWQIVISNNAVDGAYRRPHM